MALTKLNVSQMNSAKQNKVKITKGIATIDRSNRATQIVKIAKFHASKGHKTEKIKEYTSDYSFYILFVFLSIKKYTIFLGTHIVSEVFFRFY